MSAEGITIMTLLMVGIVYFYVKKKNFLIILVIFSFSVLVGVASLLDYTIPFFPYFQVFFLTFQTLVFYMTSSDYYYQRIKKDD